MKNWIVITSIYPPRDKFYEFLNQGYEIVVVGDSSTPHEQWSHNDVPSVHYLSPSAQDQLFPELSQAIGWKTYARKNIGYLYAAMNGAETIWDTDDDTFFRNGATSYFKDFNQFNHHEVKGEGYINPYNLFAPGSGIWPRGYPLRKIAVERWSHNPTIRIETLSSQELPDIVQTLVNLEPDLDAIYRMTIGDSGFDFPVSNNLYHLRRPLFAPGNTQSTLWTNKKKFSYLYIPCWVSFRFCDILKIYIAQSNASMAYAGFLSEQIRNPHDYLRDFESEVECFLNTQSIVDFISRNSGAQMTQIYGELVNANLCMPAELKCANLFETLMNEFTQ